MAKIRRVDYSPDEMIAGVVGQMDPLDFGVYWMVCTLIYSRGGPINDDPQWIAGIFKKTNPRSVRAAIDRLISSGKVQRIGAELMVNRCRNELERALNRTRTAAENGMKGGRPSSKNNDLPKPGGFEEKKLTINEQPSTNNQQPPSPEVEGDPEQEPEFLFEQWWSEYPRYRRGSKGPCRKKWLSLVKRKIATPQQLLDGLARYNAAGYTDSQYACGAERWLNDERWTVEKFPPASDVKPNKGMGAPASREQLQVGKLPDEELEKISGTWGKR